MIIHIDYNEGDQDTYQSVSISFYDKGGYKEPVVFATGDPVKDFSDAVRWTFQNGAEVYLSSSCDSFVYDGDRYGWKRTEDLGDVLYRRTDEEISRYGN